MVKELFKGLNERGVSPVIAIVLLLMMTVAAAGAAYFWITSMQSSIQESSYKSIESIMEASGRRVIAQGTLCKPTYPYEGLVGYWMMDEGSGDYANDSSKYKNDGTLYPGSDGSITSTSGMWTDGQVVGALRFDGNDSYVKVPDDNSLRFGNALTISFWIKIRNDDTIKYIIQKLQTYDDYYQFSASTSETLNWVVRTGGVRYRVLTGLTPNTWTHIVGIADDSGMKLYKNGNLIGSSDCNLSSYIGDLYFGSDHGGDRRYLNGTIDEVRIYNRALSKNEIQELYEAENNSARRRIDVTVRNIGSEEIPKATWVANLKHDGTNVETDAYNASSIDTGELSTLKFYFKNFKPNTEYAIELQGTGTSTTVSC